MGLLWSPSLILDLPATPGPNHGVGTMTFGPDGKLYVVIGDLSRECQLQNFFTGPGTDNTGVIFQVNDDGRKWASRGLAYRVYDSVGNLVRTQLVLNPAFTADR